MRILIFGINYFPEMVGVGQYTTSLSESLYQDGDEVLVVSGQPYFPVWKVFEGHPRFVWAREKLRSAVTVIRCPHYVPSSPTGARRILHHASFAIAALPIMLWTALRWRPDVVFVVAPGLVSAPMGLMAARLAGAKSWLHIQDFEVEAAFATGLLSERSFLGSTAVRFENWIHKRFDRVSSISDAMVQRLEAKGLPAERVVELRNWADLKAVAPLDGVSPMRAKLGITTPNVALYSGTIGNKQGLEIVPEAARRLAHRDDLTFVVCGDGPYLPELRRMSEGLDNIRFFPLQPMEELGDLLGMASVHLLPQIAGVADLVLPSKLTNMLASGRPVIATADPGTTLARALQGCGETVPPGDTDKLVETLERLLDNPKQRETWGRAARERALDQWDSRRILAGFRDAIHELCAAAAQPTR